MSTLMPLDLSIRRTRIMEAAETNARQLALRARRDAERQEKAREEQDEQIAAEIAPEVPMSSATAAGLLTEPTSLEDNLAGVTETPTSAQSLTGRWADQWPR